VKPSTADAFEWDEGNESELAAHGISPDDVISVKALPMTPHLRGTVIVPNEDADYYQSHKDDPDEWGPPERAASKVRRRLASMISVRFAPDEAKVVRAAAAREGQSISNFIRHAAIAHARGVFETSAFSEVFVGTDTRSVSVGGPVTSVTDSGFVGNDVKVRPIDSPA
jgi:uncharacterized protein (DUF1778 family)